jgi:plasmid maintenance system antidote protein VapI
MNEKFDVFPVYTREDASRAVEIMHKVFNRIDTDAEAARIYYAFEQILDSFEAKQTQLASTPPHVLIQEILVARGISNREFATTIGTSETALSAMLKGHRAISTKMAHRIAKALEIEPRAICTTSSKTTAA